MEILWLVVVWILLLYFIRLNRELSYYKSMVNQHKDIYIPTLGEMLESSTPGRQILTYIFDFLKWGNNTVRQKISNLLKKDSDPHIPEMIIMHQGAREK